jgi:LysM repeat protein
LDTLATCAGTTLEVMKDLNPALRRYATPPEGYAVRIPVGKTDPFVAALAKVPREVRVASVAHHKVQRGETLSGIADRYKVSVSSLSQANNLRNINHIYVGMNLVIPGQGDAPPAVAAAAPAAPVVRTASALPPKPPAAVAKPTVHTVRSGDTLSEIASKYGVSTTQLKSWNGLSGSTILVGQKLKVGSGSTGGSTASTAAAPVTSKYTIRTGDTLSGIASKFGVRMSDLQRWNNITNASNIKVGQVLVVRGGAPAASSPSAVASWTTYKVRSGDSLGAIATRNGCSVKDLMAWNALKSTTIHPGQTLKIKRG